MCSSRTTLGVREMYTKPEVKPFNSQFHAITLLLYILLTDLEVKQFHFLEHGLVGFNIVLPVEKLFHLNLVIIWANGLKT